MSTFRFHGSWVIVLSVILFVNLIPDATSQNGTKPTVSEWIRSLNSIRSDGSVHSVNSHFQHMLKPIVFGADPKAYMTPLEIISMYGYRGESHRVVTPDGYILTIFRIHPNTSPDKFRGPIFLQHGLFSSSMEWLLNQKENLLSLQLSDAGYDVWLGNSRGCTYSQGHVNLSITDPNYWEFSVNEMGKYDMPTEIDFILDLTGHAKIYYIGMSMGTTAFWVMMSHHPDFNDKVKLMIAWAPVVYLNHLPGPFRLFTLLELFPRIKELVRVITNGEIFAFGLNPIINLFGSKFCALPFPFENVCEIGYRVFLGYSEQLNVTGVQVGMGHVPAPISFRTGMHLIQFIKPGIFREYNFGKAKNMKIYGKSTPPMYDLKKTTTPCALFYGATDGFVKLVDLERLVRELPNVVQFSRIDSKYFSHGDFQFAKDQNVLLNRRVLKLLEQY